MGIVFQLTVQDSETGFSLPNIAVSIDTFIENNCLGYGSHDSGTVDTSTDSYGELEEYYGDIGVCGADYKLTITINPDSKNPDYQPLTQIYTISPSNNNSTVKKTVALIPVTSSTPPNWQPTNIITEITNAIDSFLGALNQYVLYIIVFASLLGVIFIVLYVFKGKEEIKGKAIEGAING